jgi:hypothetical protein
MLLAMPSTVIVVAAARSTPTLEAKSAAPDYARDVAPILYRNCAVCHHVGGVGPFSVLDFDSVKAYAKDIRDAVATGYMPPWHAEGPRGHFRNDRRLTDADKQTIVRWIDEGAKAGDPRSMPPAPRFDSEWEIGTPDAVFAMPTDFVVPAQGTVEYQYFEVPTNFTEDKWVKAIEIRPGARQVVHHVLVFARAPQQPTASTAAAAPAARPTPPISLDDNNEIPEVSRKDPRNAPPERLGNLIGTTAPGTNVLLFPEGTALRVRAGTTLVFQMHYTAHGHELKDRTSIGFRFTSEMPNERIIASNFLNARFVLPAGKKDIMVPSTVTFNEGAKLYGLFPHTHVRGTRWEYTLEKPDGTRQIILDVPRYDFNWQSYYLFTTPLEIPAGAKITSRAWYDNSVTNRHNPDATVDVRWGDQTWEEMQYTGFLFSLNSQRLKPSR